MDVLVTDLLIETLLISITFSIFEMALVQKIKTLSILKKDWQVILFNFVSSFIIGTLFSMWFFELSFINGLWVSLFGFIGAPAIYEILKKQNIINYTPKSLDNTITISTDNEIKRN